MCRLHIDAFLPSMSACPMARSGKTGGLGRGTVTGTATGVKEVRASRDGREAKGAIVADTDRGMKEKVTTREDTTKIR